MPLPPIDLSKVPPPDVVEQLSYQTILTEMLSAMPPQFTALVPSDPAYMLLERAAYAELIVRDRVNKAAQAVMVPYASGSDLDAIAARQNVQRLVITEADPEAVPPVEEVLESDADFLDRYLLSFGAYSSAGSDAAYKYFGRSADSDVLDIDPNQNGAGVVDVYVLSRTGDGTASAGLLTTVGNALSADEVRPLTDSVNVLTAIINTYTVSATLFFYPGPDSAVIMAQAQAALDEYIEESRRLRKTVSLSGIYNALHQEGVADVSIASPVANLAGAVGTSHYCTSTTLTNGGLIS